MRKGLLTRASAAPAYCEMKTKVVGLTLALTLIGAVLCWADPMTGTWNLNEAKSKFPAGAPKNTKVVYQNMGDQVKVTVDGVNGEGKASHNEWTGKFDGKEYAVTGDPELDGRCYTKVNDRTLQMKLMRDHKAVGSGKIVVSEDGKTRTVTNEWKDKDGKDTKVTAVYDKS